MKSCMFSEFKTKKHYKFMCEEEIPSPSPQLICRAKSKDRSGQETSATIENKREFWITSSRPSIALIPSPHSSPASNFAENLVNECEVNWDAEDISDNLTAICRRFE